MSHNLLQSISESGSSLIKPSAASTNLLALFSSLPPVLCSKWHFKQKSLEDGGGELCGLERTWRSGDLAGRFETDDELELGRGRRVSVVGE